jgi:vitamin B12 transporter
VRRPKHSANLIATGSFGRFNLGGSLAYVGKRQDTDFDLVPAEKVTLNDYVLASLNVGYRILPALEVYAQVENAFDADYQDVVGYNTPGRTIYAGLRLHFGD